MNSRLIVLVTAVVASISSSASMAAAQSATAPSTWTFRTRAIMTGVSDSSEPVGYKVYSGIATEGELTRLIDRRLEVVWTAGTHSREVELTAAGAPKVNLGSIEVLPIGAGLRYRLRPGARFRPYLGAGVTLMLFWEKSGALDSMDLTPEFGPTANLGFDYDLTPHVILNVDVRASRVITDLESNGARVATLRLHPTTLGAGVGFRF